MNSAVNIINTYPNQFPLNTITEVDLFSDQSDSVAVYHRKHGVFDVYKIRAHRNRQYAERAILFGWKNDQRISLYLANNTFPLSVCGDTKIEGTAYVPSTPIKRAYIEGKNYTNSQLIFGNYSTSKRQVPKLNSLNVLAVLEQTKYHTNYDSLITVEALQNGYNSFLNKRWILSSNEPLFLDNIKFSGNLIIISNEKIMIGANTHFKDVVFMAPNVEILDNTHGEFQCLATNSIVLGENAELMYPSNLLLFETEGSEGKKIELGRNSIIKGAVAIIPQKEPIISKRSARLKIRKNVFVDGIVYTPYRAVIESEIQIKGSLYCQETELKTPSAVYTNHLLDFKIIPGDLDDRYVHTLGYPKSKEQKAIKWLN
jgi:acetyltransferase-like isoleucine patch superfamily enzyme